MQFLKSLQALLSHEPDLANSEIVKRSALAANVPITTVQKFIDTVWILANAGFVLE